MSCKCQKCGKQYKVDLVLSTELWNQIRPENKAEGSGLLCGSCIMQKIEETSDYDYWCLVKIPKKKWQESFNK